MHGELYLIEWKTSLKPKRSLEYLNDGPLQCAGVSGIWVSAVTALAAAYLGALGCSYPQLEVPSKVLIIYALPDQQAQVWEFNRDEMLNFWQQWLARLLLYRQISCQYGPSILEKMNIDVDS